MNQPARMATYAVVVGAALILCLYALLHMYRQSHDSQSEQFIKEAMSAIDTFHSSTSRYPETLDDLPALQSRDKRIMVLFPAPKIYYYKTNHSYRIEYHQFPLGPFHGYDKENGEWYYRE